MYLSFVSTGRYVSHWKWSSLWTQMDTNGSGNLESSSVALMFSLGRLAIHTHSFRLPRRVTMVFQKRNVWIIQWCDAAASGIPGSIKHIRELDSYGANIQVSIALTHFFFDRSSRVVTLYSLYCAKCLWSGMLNSCCREHCAPSWRFFPTTMLYYFWMIDLVVHLRDNFESLPWEVWVGLAIAPDRRRKSAFRTGMPCDRIRFLCWLPNDNRGKYTIHHWFPLYLGRSIPRRISSSSHPYLLKARILYGSIGTEHFEFCVVVLGDVERDMGGRTGDSGRFVGYLCMTFEARRVGSVDWFLVDSVPIAGLVCLELTVYTKGRNNEVDSFGRFAELVWCIAHANNVHKREDDDSSSWELADLFYTRNKWDSILPNTLAFQCCCCCCVSEALFVVAVVVPWIHLRNIFLHDHHSSSSIRPPNRYRYHLSNPSF